MSSSEQVNSNNNSKEVEQILNQFIVYGQKQEPFVCAKCGIQTSDNAQKFCYCTDPDTSPNSPPNWIDNVNYPRYAKAKGTAVAAINTLINKASKKTLDTYVQDLKDATRDYCKQYPDANVNDFTGLIVGVRNQPHRIAALKSQLEKSSEK